mgnify:CR=1 FL=1
MEKFRRTRHEILRAGGKFRCQQKRRTRCRMRLVKIIVAQATDSAGVAGLYASIRSMR